MLTSWQTLLISLPVNLSNQIPSPIHFDVVPKIPHHPPYCLLSSNLYTVGCWAEHLKKQEGARHSLLNNSSLLSIKFGTKRKFPWHSGKGPLAPDSGPPLHFSVTNNSLVTNLSLLTVCWTHQSFCSVPLLHPGEVNRGLSLHPANRQVSLLAMSAA